MNTVHIVITPWAWRIRFPRFSDLPPLSEQFVMHTWSPPACTARPSIIFCQPWVRLSLPPRGTLLVRSRLDVVDDPQRTIFCTPSCCAWLCHDCFKLLFPLSSWLSLRWFSWHYWAQFRNGRLIGAWLSGLAKDLRRRHSSRLIEVALISLFQSKLNIRPNLDI